MVSRHSGHFVWIFKPIGPIDHKRSKPKNKNWWREHPNYVTVEGRRTSLTESKYPYEDHDGWFQVSRELSYKDAVKYAKAYKRAGFRSRVLFKGNNEIYVLKDEFLP